MGYDVKKVIRRTGHNRGSLIVNEGSARPEPDDFTLLIPFSRHWCVAPFFDAFHRAEIDVKKCHLVIIDNTDNLILEKRLTARAKLYAGFFKSVRLFKTWRQGGRESIVSKNPEGKKGWRSSKIPYIFELHKDMMRLCRTERFVLLEDDTIPPFRKFPHLVHRLLSILDENPLCGISTAIETGRSMITFFPVRLGVHYLEREGNRIIWRLSPGPNLSGVHKVDACGWYCCASYKDLWVRAIRDMSRYVEDVPRFALDVIHTNNIMRAGYDILADFSLWCTHMQHTNAGIFHWGKKHAQASIDLWIPWLNDYAQGMGLTQPHHEKLIRDIVRKRDRT